jgi:hypothetical protein
LLFKLLACGCWSWLEGHLQCACLGGYPCPERPMTCICPSCRFPELFAVVFLSFFCNS